jgi:lipoprotein-releasing system ATP-binding protein
MSNDAPALQLSSVHRTYRQGSGNDLHVLRGADLTLQRGEVVALVGPSGAGKSTFLHIAGLLERPDTGEVRFNGVDCGNLDDQKRTELRRSKLGFVYQFHHLLPEFSAAENVVLPQMIAGKSRSEAHKRALSLLDSMGLAARADHRPGKLSGGEQQRVAIARALANDPTVLLADEPTGNLDPDTADGVFAQLIKLAKQHGLAAIIATHNPALASRMDRTVKLDHGVLTTV